MPAALHVSDAAPKKSARRAKRAPSKDLHLITEQKRLILNSYVRLEPGLPPVYSLYFH